MAAAATKEIHPPMRDILAEEIVIRGGVALEVRGPLL
jgi:hypothetical protein